MNTRKRCEVSFKGEAIKLAKETSIGKAAQDLGICIGFTLSFPMSNALSVAHFTI